MTAIIHEILLPEGSPDFEWVRGRALQKMSPATVHSFVQKAILRIVEDWARMFEAGEFGTAWRVRILPEGSNERRPLTPDVSYFSNARLKTISRRDERNAEYPPIAPDIAFEVISKRDEKADIEAKRADYLAAGTLRVVEVYPKTRMLHAWSAPDTSVDVAVGNAWTDDAFSGLLIRVNDLFSDYDRFIAKLGD